MRLPYRLLIALLIAGLMMIPALAFTGSGWLPDYTAQLGIRASDAPAVTVEFNQFESVLDSPLKFKELAGVEYEAGLKVTVVHAGNMRWTTDIEGVPVNPAAIRIKVEGQDKIFTFLPDRETLKLKLYKRPPFRSSAIPRGKVN